MVVDEILEGKFHTGDGSLDFSCPRVTLSLQADTACEGSFFVYGPEGVVTEGTVAASDLRMTCVTKRFGGSEDEILYRFDAAGMEAGQEVSGSFSIVSNRGEYELPFQVTVLADEMTSSLGEIKNLFHFTNLARSNWAEAVALFYEPRFKKVFTGHDRQYYAAYKGLSAVDGNEHNVEEFLQEIHKKKPVEFLTEESEIRLEDPSGDARFALVINRNGWGYTRLRFQAEGEFLKLQEETAGEDSFSDNIYRLYYRIDPEKLHGGNNYGAIVLVRENGTLRIPVTVVQRVAGLRKHGTKREKKQLTVQLMEYYQAHRLKKIGKTTWLAETEKLLTRMEQLDDKDIAVKLFRGQMLLSQERGNEAKWQIEKLRERVMAEREENPALWCYYLYLTTLTSEEDSYVDEVAETVSQIYSRRKGDWRIAWLLLYLSEEYVKSVSRRWLLLEELFIHHCTSPMIYIEAWNILCMNPAMLRKLDLFEEQILTYVVKNGVMQEEILLQVVYLAGQKKSYSESLFRILKGCYELIPHKEVLHEICTLLIKGNRSGEVYFPWYLAGVEENLRITRLYEYYMMSLPRDFDGELPKMVLLYFAYRSDLHYEVTAYLYAYVHRRREELADIYVNYITAMERFVLEQISRGRINRDLAYLYDSFLTASMIDEQTARSLVSLLFMREVRTEAENAREVLLAYACRSDIKRFPITEGRAFVPVYDNDCRVLLGDGEGNFFSAGMAYSMEALMKPAGLALMIAPFVRNHLGYAVYACYAKQHAFVVQDDNADLFALLSASERIEEEEKRKIRPMMVDFYHERDRMRELDEYLLMLHPEDVSRRDRGKIVRFLVSRGMYEEACGWVRCFGPYDVDAKTLLKLGSRLLDLTEAAEEPFLTGMLLYVAQKGKYDDNVLDYLVRWFNGSIGQMRDIWRLAEDFGVDTYRLCERMLVQMLYTGVRVEEWLDIFRSYTKCGGSERVRAAFVSACCYDYVVKEADTDPYVFESVRQLYQEEAPIHPVCRIAYLRYYADRERDEEVQKPCGDFLESLLSQGIVMPFYRSYFGCVPQLGAYLDKTMVEYRTTTGARVMIHYMIQEEGAGGEEYTHEEMRDMFGGICVRDFILFFGEQLRYYITEESEAGEQLVVSDVIRKGDAGEDIPEGRFGILNDIMIGKTLQDYDTVNDLLSTYFRQDHMVDQIFTVR
ncbi:MAG: hypothetical protein K2M20_03310 [Lachnospiraceae bacterium]|nr:hypothetical protein [Lachnospiraceae bacterium]